MPCKGIFQLDCTKTSPAALPHPRAEVVIGLVFPVAHMLVSQVGERLPSPGIRWMSDDVNM